MHRKLRIFAILILSVGLTFLGLFQTLLHKAPSVIFTACWFPLGIIAKKVTGNEILMIVAAIMQFPLLGFMFEVVRRQYRLRTAWFSILIAYVSFLLVALAILRT